ncbi:MAG TPA: DUF2474 domain-containing protein [Sphingomonas sp.]|jgi:hypothetical protein|nr:DUF2474 domain-containing protein [Sphingomonas sp.]
MDGTNAGPWWKRIIWLFAIWAMSLATLGSVAFVIRLWLKT